MIGYFIIGGGIVVWVYLGKDMKEFEFMVVICKDFLMGFEI